MKTLKDRVAKSNIDTNYVNETVQHLKKIHNLYVFGAGDRAITLAQYLSRVRVNIEGFLVNEAYLNDKTIASLEGHNISVSSYEKKLEEEHGFSIVVGISQSLLNMEMFNQPAVKEVFFLNLGCQGDYLIAPEVYEQHINELNWLYDKLEDDYSRELLYTNLIGRLSGKDIKFTPSEWSNSQYFMSDLMNWYDEECFMNGGAYVGDTVEEFLAKKGNNVSHYKVYAWEPDLNNFKILSKNYADNPNVILLRKGMYSRSGVLRFSSCEENGTASCIADDGDIEIEVNTIDEVAGSDKVTIINMDIEGAELEALKGARHQIMNNTPRLAICLYHKQEDLWTIPQYIFSLNKTYKFYLKTHYSMPTELVLYCIPDSL